MAFEFPLAMLPALALALALLLALQIALEAGALDACWPDLPNLT